MKNLSAFILALACCTAAGAQTIYRCGASYSQNPCEGAAVVQAADTGASAQAAQAARAQAQRDAKLADAMEKQRLKEEAKPVQVYIPPTKQVSTVEEGKPKMVKPGKPQYFSAVSPKKPAEKKSTKKDD